MDTLSFFSYPGFLFIPWVSFYTLGFFSYHGFLFIPWVFIHLHSHKKIKFWTMILKWSQKCPNRTIWIPFWSSCVWRKALLDTFFIPIPWSFFHKCLKLIFFSIKHVLSYNDVPNNALKTVKFDGNLYENT